MTEETKPEQTKEANWLTLVQQLVRSLRYGVVQIVVHDGRVTQVEKTEKVRLDQSSQASKS
jgi:hypothetical protein